MSYLVLIAAGLVVGGFLLALDLIVFGLNTLTEKCEEWKKRTKEEK